MATLRSVVAAVALFLAVSCGLSRQRLARMPHTSQAAMTRLETTANGASRLLRAVCLRLCRLLLLPARCAVLRCRCCVRAAHACR
jgi:hypothetical protein